MKAIKYFIGSAFSAFFGMSLAAQGATQPYAPPTADSRIASALTAIRPALIQANLHTLVGFGTRSTLSSMETGLPAGHGINAAVDWAEAEFRRIGAGCGGCLQVEQDSFVTEPVPAGQRSNRYARETRLRNVYAILHGTDAKAPWVLVTGHIDSRVNDVMNATADAPGANDDGSGVAVSLECARALSKLKLPGTIVFAIVSGEEQGLTGSAHLAKLAKEKGWLLEAVLNDDIVGGDTTPGAPANGPEAQRKNAVRVFSESVPSSSTPAEQRAMLGLGAENDSPSRELARSIVELAPAYFTPDMQSAHRKPGGRHNQLARQVLGFHAVPILRRDRYLRGGDHTSFNAEGFTAVRFTEWRENFNHQHQDMRVENGVQYGDLEKFVDFGYVADVAKLNAATLATLASAPSEPAEVHVLTHDLDNNTELEWKPGAYVPAGTHYLVVWRPTAEFGWQQMADAGTDTHLKLNVSKDNVLFGVMAVDKDGHRSLPVPPTPAR